MSLSELIAKKADALPADLQQEALRYMDYLLARDNAGSQERDWAKFSAEQLARQYAPGDAIYDQDCRS